MHKNKDDLLKRPRKEVVDEIAADIADSDDDLFIPIETMPELFNKNPYLNPQLKDDSESFEAFANKLPAIVNLDELSDSDFPEIDKPSKTTILATPLGGAVATAIKTGPQKT